MTFLAPIPAVQLQLGNVSTTDGDLPVSLASQMSFFSVSQMPFLQGADGPALRSKGRTRNQCGDLRLISLGTVASSNIPAVSVNMIF